MVEFSKDELSLLVQAVRQMNIPGSHCKQFGIIIDKLEFAHERAKQEEVSGKIVQAGVESVSRSRVK